MYFSDYHCHTAVSPDGKGTISEYLQCAEQAGLAEIAITDHYDVNTSVDPDFKMNEEDQAESFRSASSDSGRVLLRMGIEIGQASYDVETIKRLLAAHEYDVVLSSFHNLNKGRDFYYYEYEKTDIQKLFLQYLQELADNFSYEDFDICTHLTYPHRYIANSSAPFFLEDYEEAFRAVLKKIIEMDKALEFNTSTLRKGLPFPMPGYYVAKLYYELGGRIISLGSDAHTPQDVGGKIQEVAAALREIGFNEHATYCKRKRTMRPL